MMYYRRHSNFLRHTGLLSEFLHYPDTSGLLQYVIIACYRKMRYRLQHDLSKPYWEFCAALRTSHCLLSPLEVSLSSRTSPLNPQNQSSWEMTTSSSSLSYQTFFQHFGTIFHNFYKPYLNQLPEMSQSKLTMKIPTWSFTRSYGNCLTASIILWMISTISRMLTRKDLIDASIMSWQWEMHYRLWLEAM